MYIFVSLFFLAVIFCEKALFYILQNNSFQLHILYITVCKITGISICTDTTLIPGKSFNQ